MRRSRGWAPGQDESLPGKSLGRAGLGVHGEKAAVWGQEELLSATKAAGTLVLNLLSPQL